MTNEPPLNGQQSRFWKETFGRVLPFQKEITQESKREVAKSVPL